MPGDRTYTVTLAEVRAQPIAVVRRRAELKELTAVVPEACEEVWRLLREHNFASAGRNVALYLDEAINMECGVEVTDAFTGAGVAHRSETPAGRVAVTEHVGPYRDLGAAHRAVRAWCRDHGHELAGPSWEVYGPYTDNPEMLVTTVFYLVDCWRGGALPRASRHDRNKKRTMGMIRK